MVYAENLKEKKTLSEDFPEIKLCHMPNSGPLFLPEYVNTSWVDNHCRANLNTLATT